jgi:hypothetical protein
MYPAIELAVNFIPLPQVRSADEATVRAAYEQILKDIHAICMI